MDYTDRRVDLIEEGFDLSVRITARLGAGEVVRRLGTCRLLAAAAPGYLARHGVPQRPADLADHVCLGYLGDPDPGAWPFTIDGRVEHVHVQTRLAASNGDVLADAAARGLGITLQPDFIVASYLDDGRLRPLLAEFAPPELGIYALLPAGRHVTYRVRVLIEFLAERLKGVGRGQGPQHAPTPVP